MLLLILSLLLSLLCGDKSKEDVVVASGGEPICTTDYSPNRDLCITAAQGQSFAGYESSNSVSVRTTCSGRRILPQTGSTFRVIKGGKVIDNNRTHPFLTPAFVPLSGMHISERYLFSICRLRL